jgi:hypothetical protein
MLGSNYYSSKDIKQLLGVRDCELMHLRVANKLKFKKKGNAFLYQLPDKKLLLNHPIAKQLIDWYQQRHPISLDNLPKEDESIDSLIKVIEEVLIPVSNKFGAITVTYGFVSAELNKFIQKNSSSGTYPSIDQHSASEFNKANNQICKRHGIACDFIVQGYEKEMNKVMPFIVNDLDFDKIYYYGKDRPLHVSVGNESEHHLQIMNVSDKGRRIPGKKAYGDEAKQLAEEQQL